MLEFIRRGSGAYHTVGDCPPWLSSLLLSRGIDTPEKAERFLHPSLLQLHDPMLMQGMDKAVRVIREAVLAGEKILVYGDYDVDGVCATCVMMETLRQLGATADYRIPNRHAEGYGLNEKAVREAAEKYKLLITVDCGVTNLEEVKLAKLLGMRVIVTDHHQLAEALPAADAVLDPLLGAYPFRRLCGAGVALKVCQALLGMGAAEKLLEVAALATVADIVPLIDENRVIVREGLQRLSVTERPGLRALMTISGVGAGVTSEEVAFRLAPRINAGGRLEDASLGVRLLMTQDVQEAEQLAAHLNESNQQRQAVEREITQAAGDMVSREVDFRDDKAIIVMGEGWNSGVIGLTAGRLCEKWHFPTIVLSRQGEIAVGSCRSIPGVNIHAMLSRCKDLFLRFGGHEQAAGLTMRAELVPELKRRLNLAIGENCDERCYIPREEYDLELPLSQVTLEWIDQLAQLQPTGCGNPAPVFLTRDAQVQQARRVGKDLNHLKIVLLDGEAVKDGIGFSLGDAADEGLERVDVLFAAGKNEFRGKVTSQLQVKALRAAQGAAPAPAAQVFFQGLLQEMTVLAANFNKIHPEGESITEAGVRRLLEAGRGTLLLAHERERAMTVAMTGLADVCIGQVKDRRGFNTLLCAPQLEELRDNWRHVVLLDGCVLPGEAEEIRRLCPRAQLHCMKPNPLLTAQLASLALDRQQLNRLYAALRQETASVAAIAEKCGLSAEQVQAGLAVFAQLELAQLTMEPFRVVLLPMKKCDPAQSPLMRYWQSLCAPDAAGEAAKTKR